LADPRPLHCTWKEHTTLEQGLPDLGRSSIPQRLWSGQQQQKIKHGIHEETVLDNLPRGLHDNCMCTPYHTDFCLWQPDTCQRWTTMQKCSPIPPALLELPPLDMKKRIKELMLQPTTARMQPSADVTDFMQRAALRVPAVYSLHCGNSQSRTCCCWEFLSKQKQDPGLSQTGHDPWQAWL